MNPLLQQFVAEAREFLQAIGDRLMQLEKEPASDELMNDLFRLVHTLKGNSGLFEFPAMTRLLHAGEDLMDAVREGEVAFDTDLADQLLDAMDVVGAMVDGVEDTGELDDTHTPDAERLAANLRAILAGEPLPEASPEAEAEASAAPEDADAVAPDETLRAFNNDARCAAWSAAISGQSLVRVAYAPEPECFFKGEDPFAVARQLPGIVGMVVRPLTPFAALAEIDCYQCNLEFDLLVCAEAHDVEHHFRYVPEQVTVTSLPASALLLPLSETPDPKLGAAAGIVRDVLASEDLSALESLASQFAHADDHLTAALGAWLNALVNSAQPDAALTLALAQELVDTLASMPAVAQSAAPEDADADSCASATSTARSALNERALGSVTEDELPVLQDILAAQVAVLGLPNAGSWLPGRLGAVAATLSACLAHIGPEADGFVPGLAAARDEALDLSSSGPLVVWLEQFLAWLGPLAGAAAAAREVVIDEATTRPEPETTVVPLGVMAEDELPRLARILEAQARILALPDEGSWLHGRLAAVARTLEACVRNVQGEHESLQKACDEALASDKAAPLAAWLEDFLATTGAVALGDELMDASDGDQKVGPVAAGLAELAEDEVPRLLMILDAQAAVLALPNEGSWLGGRLKAAAATLAAAASVVGEKTDALEAALTQALKDESSDPLVSWLEGFRARMTPTSVAAEAASVEAPVAPVEAVAAKKTVARAKAVGDTVALAEEADEVAVLEAPAPAAKAAPKASPTPASPAAADGDGGKAGGNGARRADEPVPVLKVEQPRIDRLMSLIGEMVVAKNGLPYLATRAEEEFGVRELSREIKSQYGVINRIAEELQDAIMQVRMMPVSFIFQRFPRLVRDTSRKIGKEVDLVLEGEETEADKNVIESLADPLIHIIRNSLDHGIEAPDVREAAGKPRRGKLIIRAQQDSDHALIEIIDDGKGIDPVKVKQRAYERGLIDEQRLESISDQDAVNLVFLAGFSTAEQITDLSGRGVGMDVVRAAVERVGGTARITSKVGKGTTLRLSLPLSMAVSNVMVIESDGQIFGVPMDRVVETVRLPADEIRGIKNHRTTVLRDQIIPLTPINELLAIDAEPKLNEDGEVAVLVVRIDGRPFGFMIDDFHEVVDVILKPLPGELAKLSCYAGSALLGDGSVLMVLNPQELI